MSVEESKKNRMIYKLLDNIKVNESGCFLWLRSVRWQGGYAQVCDGKKACGGHRVSYELFRGPIPDGMFVCHRCNVKRCVNPAHLYLGTNGQNINDALTDGLMPVGERHHQSKLTEEIVSVMRSRYSAGESVAALAIEFGVAHESARRAISGGTWSHVSGAAEMRNVGSVRGEKCHRSKVTDEQVREIRDRAASGMPYRQIAAMFGLSASHTQSLAAGRYRGEA